MKRIEEAINKAVSSGEIAFKDKSLYRFLLYLFHFGPEGIPYWMKRKRRKWFTNLEKNGYFAGNKIIVEKGFNKDSLGIHLMACIALGWLEVAPLALD